MPTLVDLFNREIPRFHASPRSAAMARLLALAIAGLTGVGPVSAGYGKFVLTGAPGAGKSTILAELARQGHLTASEAFTALHERAEAEGILEAFLGDAKARQRNLMEHQLKAETGTPRAEPLFLDRGTLDITFFRARGGVEMPAEFDQQGNGNPYDLVFFVDQMPEALYVTTTVRKDTYREASGIDRELALHYQNHGYRANLVRVPRGTPDERTRFILDTILERYRFADVIDHFAGVPAGRISWFAGAGDRLARPFSGPVALLEVPLGDRDRPYRFFGIEKDRQGEVDYPAFKRKLAGHLNCPAKGMLELVGDFNRFSVQASAWATRYLRPHFDRAGIIEYGFTGYRHGGELDVNSFVNQYVEDNPRQAGKVLANIVGHTHTALLKWGTSGSPLVRNFVVVYNREGMTAPPAYDDRGRKTGGHTAFGEDVPMSDLVLQAADGDRLICLEGGAKSFKQVLNAMRNKVPVELVTGLRKAGDRNRFSAAGWLFAVRQGFKDGNVPTPGQVRAAFTEYSGQVETLFDPTRPDHKSKRELFDMAMGEFIDGGLYRELGGGRVTFVHAEFEAPATAG